MKFNFKSEIFPIALVLISFGFGIYFYEHFPARVVTHWNFIGQPNRYASKEKAAFIFPGIMLLIYMIFAFIPFLDPRKENYSSFEKTYREFRSLILLMFLTIFLATGYYNLGYNNIRINIITPLAVGLLIFAMGSYLNKIKSNWFFGIRTPWTLSSEKVWEKTHRFGGKAFRICGALIVVSVFLPKNFSLIILIAAILTASLGSVIYSYFAYRTEQKNIHK